MKENAANWTIREQIIDDPSSGLTLQFETVPDDDDGRFRLRIYGDLPYGNRELQFSVDGKQTGSGIALTGSCRPTWMVDIGD